MIYKRGEVYHYSFLFKGRRYRRSTHQGNLNVARSIESARRTELAKGIVGLQDKPRIPTLREFAPEFERAIEIECSDKPKTIAFYKERLRKLLDFEPFKACALDAIDEKLVEKLKEHRARQRSRLGRPLSVATINRELATLRRLLRLAADRKVIARAPKIKLFKGEHEREFVLSYSEEERYLAAAREPLCDIAMLILDSGARLGEACALEWQHVRIEPAPGANFGHLRIVEGKSPKAKRNLSLTARVAEMLERRRKAQASDRFVFPSSTGAPFLVSSLDHEHSELRELLGMSPRLRGTLAKAHHVDASGRVRSRCFHYHEDRRAQQCDGIAALRASIARIARKSLRAAGCAERLPARSQPQGRHNFRHRPKTAQRGNCY